jgi:carbamoyl-phosphate synthase large subunit
MDRVRVMVTGVGGGGIGEQLIKALRLASTPYWIVGGDITPRSKGLMEVDEPFLLPPANDQSYPTMLLEACERYQVRAVLPGSDPEIKALDRIRNQVARRGIFLPIQPSAVLERCFDKAKTAAMLGELGFGVPVSREVRTPADLEGFRALPAVLKPSQGGGGSAHVYLAQSEGELAFFSRYLLDLFPEILVQEYVGTPDAEYTVGVLTDMQGKLLQSIAVRRNIQPALSNRLKVPNKSGRPELGPTLIISNGLSQGEIGPFPEVCEPCERLAIAMSAAGPLNIQCRLAGDRIYVFEINPRFSGTTSLRAMVGFNEPDLLIRRHVLGEEVQPRFSYQSGYIARGLQETLIRPLEAAAR